MTPSEIKKYEAASSKNDGASDPAVREKVGELQKENEELRQQIVEMSSAGGEKASMADNAELMVFVDEVEAQTTTKQTA